VLVGGEPARAARLPRGHWHIVRVYLKETAAASTVPPVRGWPRHPEGRSRLTSQLDSFCVILKLKVCNYFLFLTTSSH
jgi:hypothetical protein